MMLFRVAAFFLFTVLLPSFLSAQKATYYRHVQPILYKHCISCHRPGQIGPFPLLTYDDAKRRADMIMQVTRERYMPPFHVDTSFQRYHGERLLTEKEIATIATWVNRGAAPGDKSVGLNWKDYIEQQKLPQPGLIVRMPDTLYLSGNMQDQYRLLVLPINNPDTLYVSGIDLVPSNRKIAHHGRIMVDTSHQYRPQHRMAIDSIPEEEQINVPVADNYFKGWAPGNLAVFYPDSAARMILPYSDLIINMHYAGTPIPATDQPEVHLYLAPAPPKRLVQTFALEESSIVNKPFVIPPDTVMTFIMRTPPLPFEMLLLNVQPHMHNLGAKVRAYAITPAGDLVPLIRIQKWDFKWQSNYRFLQPLRLPKGTVVYAEFSYDNTPSNYANPFFPPRVARFGWRTTDEMCNLIFEYIRP